MDNQRADDRANAGKGTARPYRSKKQRPCDGCRRRRVGCFVPPDQKDCTLCHHRGRSCTFELAAPVKKGRTPRSRGARARQAPLVEEGEDHVLGDASAPDIGTSPMSHGSSSGGSRWKPYQGTVVAGRTALYVGNSSDQDVYLLRHLPFDESNSFGRTNWRVGKIFADETRPAYFTSYPNRLLDAKEGIYDLEPVDAIVNPHQTHLLSLYYTYVYPSLPILEDRDRLEAGISAGTVPASLLAAVYGSAIPFWHHSPALKGVRPIPRSPLHDLVFRSVSLEARTPSLQTIQAMLLYMQLLPSYVREPNHPGFWALTCQLVGLAQETGLHIDPTSWNICSSERHTRRILWWAVYLHDKWLAHWLGRPSHIDDRQFSVAPLTIDDFTEIATRPIDTHLSHSVAAFVMLSRLTTVLSSVLDNFYTINRSSCVMSPEEALSRASQCQSQLRDCLAQQEFVLLRPSRMINDYAFVFAYYGIAVSIQRALFASVGGTSYYDTERETMLFQDLFAILEDLLEQNNIDGLWLSYCKSYMAIIGSFIVTALLSSTDDDVYQTRQGILDGFRHLL